MSHISSTARMLLRFLITAILLVAIINHYSIVYAQDTKPLFSFKEPIISDPMLKVEKVLDGLSFPTGMAFLGLDDILVIEKNNGTVYRFLNGVMSKEPLLDLNVANLVERGLLGIAVEKDKNGPTYVFLYCTETISKDGNDISIDPLGNRLYRYELSEDGTRLIRPHLLLDLPATPKPVHNGGVLTIGPDNHVYTVIGDVDVHRNPAQNSDSEKNVDGTSGILRITRDGEPIAPGIIGDNHPLNLYYAYGIRNSFGLDFDPVTGKLWDTENGDWYGDEINLVDPGFNSGWRMVQGKSSLSQDYNNKTFNSDDLEDFNEKGVYSDPEFSWNAPVGVTSIKFLNSDKLGKQYQNDMFVGDFHNGYLYHFDLNNKRTDLSLKGPLADKLANNEENDDELKQVIFGNGFGAITDIEVGPDGYLYVMSLKQGGPNCDPRHPKIPCVLYDSEIKGGLYKIVPR
jgi:aldose sugar dehydrogenase